MEVNETEVVKKVSELTTKDLEISKKRKDFVSHVNKIKKINDDFKSVENNMDFTSFFKKHTKGLKNLEGKKAGDILNILNEQKQDANDFTNFQKLITVSKAGYREIISFRTFLTGQELKYLIKNKNGDVYELNEDQFISLFSDGIALRDDASKIFKEVPEDCKKQIELSERGIRSFFMRKSKFQLSENYLNKVIEDNKLKPVYSLKENSLYQAIQSKKITAARAFEVYQQITFDIESGSKLAKRVYDRRAKNGINNKALDNYLKDYDERNIKKIGNKKIGKGGLLDNAAFYKIGDAIKISNNQYIGYELKDVSKGAFVSINTIRNAIRRLANIFNKDGGVSEQDMIRRLSNILLQKGLGGGIELAAMESGEQRIKEMINSMGFDKNTKYIFT